MIETITHVLTGLPSIFWLATAFLLIAVLWRTHGFWEQILLVGRLLVRGSRRSPVTSPLDETELRRRVRIGDCDPNLHMTNSRYLVIADEARFDLLIRAGFGSGLRKGLRTLVGTTCVRYRRDLPLFKRYTIRTRLLAWDDKWIYIESRFMRDGRTAVHLVSKSMPMGPDGKVTPAALLKDLFGESSVPPSPPLPENARILLRDSDPLLSPD